MKNMSDEINLEIKLLYIHSP